MALRDYLPQRVQDWLADQDTIKKFEAAEQAAAERSAKEDERHVAMPLLSGFEQDYRKALERPTSELSAGELNDARRSFNDYLQDRENGISPETAWELHARRMGAQAPEEAMEPEPDWEKMSNEMLEPIVTRDHVLFEHHDELGQLHREPSEGPAKSIIEYGDEVSTSRSDIYAVHGEITAQSTHEYSRDEERERYKETWFNKDGQIHREGNDPAVIIRDVHYIPDETYLDEARQEIWKNGVEISSTDTTWEDIVSHKGLTPDSLRWMGYDPEEPVRQTPTEDIYVDGPTVTQEQRDAARLASSGKDGGMQHREMDQERDLGLER